MLYIERNADGAISAIHQTPTDTATEQKTTRKQSLWSPQQWPAVEKAAVFLGAQVSVG